MKLSAIKKIIMDAKRCVIVNDAEGNQWIGDGKRFYSVDEDFRFERETVLTVLDVDKEKRNKVAVFQENTSDPRFSIYQPPADSEPTRGEALRPRMAIMYGGELVVVFMTDRREVFALEHAYLKPVELGREYMLLRRETFGEEMRPAIAVSTDMFVSALLTPMPQKVARAIIAEVGLIADGETKAYGKDDEEELVKGTDKAE